MDKDYQQEGTQLSQLADLSREFSRIASNYLRLQFDINSLLDYMSHIHRGQIYRMAGRDRLDGWLHNWLSARPQQYINEIPVDKTDYEALVNGAELSDKLAVLQLMKNSDSSLGDPEWAAISKQLEQAVPFKERELNAIGNIWNLPQQARYRLMRTWWDRLVGTQERRVKPIHVAYMAAVASWKEHREKIELHVLQRACVVGMTTTGAAKFRHLLRQMHPRIVLVEEAAEILEQQVITSLGRFISNPIHPFWMP